MRREGAWHAPSRALRRTMLDRKRGGKNKRKTEESERKGKEKTLRRQAQGGRKREDHSEETGNKYKKT